MLGRQHLGSHALLGLFFPGKQIGKGAANINANTPHESAPLSVNQLLPTSSARGKGEEGKRRKGETETEKDGGGLCLFSLSLSLSFYYASSTATYTLSLLDGFR